MIIRTLLFVTALAACGAPAQAKLLTPAPCLGCTVYRPAPEYPLDKQPCLGCTVFNPAPQFPL